ncbi:MAG TPA: DUF3035 domain-containing protein [Verrucomicrobiae bacterium]|jgi:hypothetical protein|nr:DUF3035 domain-containing protein [Verrucomicrobiae bacterium]
MRASLPVLLLVAAAGLALSGCTATMNALGMGKHPPDEFVVVTHPPLEVPADLTLVPPQPGAPRPQEESAAQLAEAAVLGTGAQAEGTDTASSTQILPSGPATAGEEAFLQNAGVAKADPKIRQLVDTEAQAESDAIKDNLYNKILFWQTQPPPGTVVDAKAEQQRLQENAALGKPLTQGPTPVIVRRKRAMLEGIF